MNPLQAIWGWVWGPPLKQPDAPASFEECGEEAHLLVMRELLGKLAHYSSNGVWMTHDYRPESWNPKFDAEQARINSIRAWASTLPDRCFRKHYSVWLDYFQRELDDARNELRTQTIKIQMDAHYAENKARDARVSEYQREHGDIPTIGPMNWSPPKPRRNRHNDSGRPNLRPHR